MANGGDHGAKLSLGLGILAIAIGLATANWRGEPVVFGLIGWAELVGIILLVAILLTWCVLMAIRVRSILRFGGPRHRQRLHRDLRLSAAALLYMPVVFLVAMAGGRWPGKPVVGDIGWGTIVSWGVILVMLLALTWYRRRGTSESDGTETAGGETSESTD